MKKDHKASPEDLLKEFLATNQGANLFYDAYTKRFENERRTVVKAYSKALIEWLLNEEK